MIAFECHAVAETGIVPVRKIPSEKSEMVNQLLLGETVLVRSRKSGWLQIICRFDDYEGWVAAEQMKILSEADYHQWISESGRQRFPYRTCLMRRSSKMAIQVPVGACVPITAHGIEWFGETYHFQSEPMGVVESSVLDTALHFLGVSYLWGGRSDLGLDCSGLIQTAYMLHHTPLPRDSRDQFESGNLKGTTLEIAEAGDLIFFRYPDRQITHIGFYLGEGLLLHASGSVRIDRIDPGMPHHASFAFNKELSRSIAGVIGPFSPHIEST